MNVLVNMQFILPIIINGIILKYLYKLDKIKYICSDLPEKNNIINAYWIFMAFSILQLLKLPTYFGMNIGKLGLEIGTGLLGIYLIYIVYILIQSIRFVRTLKKIQCKCSESWVRQFMYITNILNILMIGLIMIGIIIIGIILVMGGSNKLLSAAIKR